MINKIVPPKTKPTEPAPADLAQKILGKFETTRLDAVAQHKAVLSKVDDAAKQLRSGLADIMKQLYGYAEGYQVGYAEGFTAGIKHLVTATEEEMTREMKLASREELVAGKLPAFWILTLVKNLERTPSLLVPPHLKVYPLEKQPTAKKRQEEPEIIELDEITREKLR